jgi:beta-1,4-mannosyl-glycoprotein beta-1,4-N-acetylglucosaminyltransferase
VGQAVSPRVYDTFLYSGLGTEPDMLECRLTELEGCVDYHVIVEGTLTFQGEEKPLAFKRDCDRYARWLDRVIYVEVTPSTVFPGKQPGDAWAREHYSRQSVVDGLAQARLGDIVMHGDVDEIPTPAAVASLLENPIPHPHRLRARWCDFAVDWLMPPECEWLAPSVALYAQVGNFTELRETAWPAWPHRSPGSWHLTWLGGPEAMRQKVRAFSHAEQVPQIDAGVAEGLYYERGVGWHDGRHGIQQAAVDVDETWPRWIWESWDPVRRRRRPGGPAPASWFRPRQVAVA